MKMPQVAGSRGEQARSEGMGTARHVSAVFLADAVVQDLHRLLVLDREHRELRNAVLDLSDDGVVGGSEERASRLSRGSKGERKVRRRIVSACPHCKMSRSSEGAHRPDIIDLAGCGADVHHLASLHVGPCSADDMVAARRGRGAG